MGVGHILGEKSVFIGMKHFEILKWTGLRAFFGALGFVIGLHGCTYIDEDDCGAELPVVVTFLDVGQGLAVLLEYDGRYALYDTGPDSVGVMDSLVARGIDTLMWVVVGHNHRDHGGGFMELGSTGSEIGSASLGGSAPRVHVGRLYVGPDTAGGFVRDSVLRLAWRFGIPVDTLARGNSLYLSETASHNGASTHKESAQSNGSAVRNETAPRFEVLWPPEYLRVGENGASVVVRMEYGASSLLLTGDLDSIGERRLLELFPTLDADLMQVGHHGSAGSSSLRFVSQVAPQYAVVSVGEGNSYGHPANSTIRKFGYVLGDSTRLYRTDRDGSVTFELYRDLGVIK